MTRLPAAGAARTGDLVRARVEDSERVVEGILQLRYVPALDYVQVLVDSASGTNFVDHRTVQVLERRARDPKSLESGDPLVEEPGWRRVRDLAEAERRGLLPAVRDVAFPTWEALERELDRLVAPLLVCGWTLASRNEDPNAVDGNELLYTLFRGQLVIDVALGDTGFINVYLYDEDRVRVHDDGELVFTETSNEDEDEDPSDPLFGAEDAPQLWAKLDDHGWLSGSADRHNGNGA